MAINWRSDPDAETILTRDACVPWVFGEIRLDQIDWSESSNNCARLGEPLNRDKISDYADSMRRGDIFPSVVVERSKNGFVILGGNQRCAAVKEVDDTSSIDCYIVDPLTTCERELVIRSLNSRHGWGSDKSERLEHAVFLVRKHGIAIEVAARAMCVGATTIATRIRSEEVRAELARGGVDSSKLPICSLSAIGRIQDDAVRKKVALAVVETGAKNEDVANVVGAVLKSKGAAEKSKVVSNFVKSMKSISAATTPKQGQMRKPRRDKFLRLLTTLCEFLETGNDGASFSTLDELSCSVTCDLDDVRVKTAILTNRLKCICEAGK